MRRLHTTPMIALALAGAMTSVACSKGSNPGSPLAPTSNSTVASSPGPTTAPTATTSAGATISGVVVSGTSAGAALQAASVSRVLVTVLGTAASTMTDDKGGFTLQNVPPGTQTLSINGNGIAAQVSLTGVTTNEQIRVTVRVDANNASLDDRQRESADSQFEVEGVISAVSGSTITVGRLNTSVSIAPTAIITRAGVAAKLTDLLPGVRVEVHGTKVGTVVTADRITIEDAAPQSGGATPTTDDRNSNVGEVALSGSLSARPTGSCPAVTFVVAATTVVTNNSTQFDDAVCGSLAAGDTVTVEGTKQSSGQVLAREVKRTSSTGSSSSGSSSGSSGSNGSGADDKGSSSGGNSGSGSGSGNSGKGK